MNDNLYLHDLLNSLCLETVIPRLYPLIPYKDSLKVYMQMRGLVFRDDVASQELFSHPQLQSRLRTRIETGDLAKTVPLPKEIATHCSVAYMLLHADGRL